MRLRIHRKGIEIDDEIESHIERRLLFALGRFTPRIQRVAVHLADLNGPKGGVDKHCRLVVSLVRAGVVAVEDQDAELLALIDRAADRLGRSVQRTLERKRFADSGGRGELAHRQNLALNTRKRSELSPVRAGAEAQVTEPASSKGA